MINEADIGKEKASYYQLRAEQVIKNLQKRKMKGFFVENRRQALSAILEMIPPGAVVARGDSISIDQIGLLPEIKQRKSNVLIDPFETDADGHWPENRERMMRETFSADIFITGTNAVTLDGKIVNIDGYGNRVSAMIFGPGKVILVVGANKIVKDVPEALDRIRNYAAPVNATRHYNKHQDEMLGGLPCVKTGSCADCRHDWRICNYVTVIEGAMPPHKDRINLVIIGEELGI
jgi:LUD domain